MVPSVAALLDIQIAPARRTMTELLRIKRPSLRWDRQVAPSETAAAAQRAADRNDSKQVYSIVKSLAGRPAAPLKGLADEHGVIITDACESRDRWRRHFTGLFKATVVDNVASLMERSARESGSDYDSPQRRPSKRRRRKEAPFEPSVDDVYKAMMSLNGDKGLGPDQMSVALLQAGGWVVAEIVHEIVLMIVHSRYIPIVWRGGKLVVLYKGKGPPSCCDSYRGLLISDHVGKIFTTLQQWHLQSSYEKEVGEVQFGAVAGRSTAMASLFLRSFIDCCKLMSWSCFV